MKTRTLLAMAAVLLAIVAFVPGSAFAAAANGTATCYNCDHFSGHWDCESGSLWGGTSCTVSQDSCTVSGNCNSSSGVGGISLSIEPGLIMDVAMIHPRVAATLYTLASHGECSEQSVVSWYNDELTIENVQTLIGTGMIGLEAVTPGVVYKATIEPFGSSDDLLLRLIALEPSDLDPPFSELLVYLTPEVPDGPYVPISWDLIS